MITQSNKVKLDTTLYIASHADARYYLFKLMIWWLLRWQVYLATCDNQWWYSFGLLWTKEWKNNVNTTTGLSIITRWLIFCNSIYYTWNILILNVYFDNKGYEMFLPVFTEQSFEINDLKCVYIKFQRRYPTLLVHC